MIIHNNLAAIQSVNQLNKNNKSDAKASKQLATGEKFSGAGEDKASEYSISEKMKTQIRALDQCTDNSKKGSNMMMVALDAVGQQVEIMKKIRALAMKSSDGVYSDSDRKILQEEVNQLLDESEELAQTTNFNGIPLLNQSRLSRQDKWFDANAPYRPIPSTIPVMPPAAAVAGGKWTVPQGDYHAISMMPPNVYDASVIQKGGAFTTMPAVGDVIFDSAGNQDTVVNNAGILCFASSNTAIEVSGQVNPPGGGVPATSTNVYMPEHPPLRRLPSLGDHVASSASASMSGTTITTSQYEVKNTPGSNALAFFVPGGQNSVATFELNTLVASLTTIPNDLDQLGFSLNCGLCSQFVTVLFDANSSISKRYGGDPNSETRDPICYSIGVASVTDANSLMETVFNGISVASGVGGTLPSTTDVSARLAQAHNIQMNYHAATGEFTISKSGPTISFLNGIRGELVVDNYYKPEQPRSLQTGTESSQYTNVRLPNTTLEALFPPPDIAWDIDPTEADFPTDWPNEYEWNHKEGRPMTEAEKRQKWTEEVWEYPSRRVSLEKDKCVATREKAARFIDDIDQALHYLIMNSTDMGAQTNRLDYTQANLVTAAENTTASESTIRDVNMAAAVLEKAKTSILSQAAQSMIAQANQNMQSVMGLLQ